MPLPSCNRLSCLRVPRAWRQGGWAIVAQIDEKGHRRRPRADGASRWTLGAAGIRKAPSVSTFPMMMARRLAGGAAHRRATSGGGGWPAKMDREPGLTSGPRLRSSLRCRLSSLVILKEVSRRMGAHDHDQGWVVEGPRGRLGALCASEAHDSF